MAVARSRKENKKYSNYLQSLEPEACAFCSIHESDERLVAATKYFKVIKNIFPYSLWDDQQVLDHLLVLPEQHTDSLADMSAEQKVDFVDLIERYEKAGYNIYARAPASQTKTVYHQHTHLIKTQGRTKHIILSVKKPYMRLAR